MDSRVRSRSLGSESSREDGRKDLFVHHTNIAGEGFKTLAENAKVEYEAREGAKGPEATNVVVTG